MLEFMFIILATIFGLPAMFYIFAYTITKFDMW